MNKFYKLGLIMLALAASVTGAFAWDLVASASNSVITKTMIVPPVLDSGTSWQQTPVRGTSITVNAGSVYRIGQQLIVAAHAGTMTNGTTSVTTVSTNGAVVTTNTVVSVAAIAVPTVGISGYDGTVRWYRARGTDQRNVYIQATGYQDQSITLTDGAGSTLVYGVPAAAELLKFETFNGTLYVAPTSASVTNTSTVKVMAW
jgi:hypothetical protein